MPRLTLKNSAFYKQCNYDYHMFVITSRNYFSQAYKECSRIIKTTFELHSDKKLILCDKPSLILELREEQTWAFSAAQIWKKYVLFHIQLIPLQLWSTDTPQFPKKVPKF